MKKESRRIGRLDGNVLAVVSDLKIGIGPSNVQPNYVDYYKADIVEMTDYYPFGMQMVKRHYVADDGYRFGFNGKENDDEWNGSGNMLDYGFRVHDPRLGRFLSVDPLAPDYPELTTYQYASNTPIQASDLDGLEKMQEANLIFDGYGQVSTSPNIPASDYNRVAISQNHSQDPDYKEQPRRRIGQPYQNSVDGATSDFFFGYRTRKHYISKETAESLVILQEHGSKTFVFPKILTPDGEYPDVRVKTWPSGKVTYSIDLEYDYLGYFVGLKTRPWVIKSVVPDIVGGPVGSGSRILNTTRKQLQKKFDHAIQFGVEGNWSNAAGARFESALKQHVNSAEVMVINGTYRGESAIHYLNPNTGLNVITRPSGQFWSCWELNPKQLENVVNHGGL